MMFLKEGNERKICIAVFGRLKVTVPTCRAGSSEWAKSCRSILANTPEPESGTVLIYQDFYCTKQRIKSPSWGLDHLTGIVYKQKWMCNTWFEVTYDASWKEWKTLLWICMTEEPGDSESDSSLWGQVLQANQGLWVSACRAHIWGCTFQDINNRI